MSESTSASTQKPKSTQPARATPKRTDPTERVLVLKTVYTDTLTFDDFVKRKFTQVRREDYPSLARYFDAVKKEWQQLISKSKGKHTWEVEDHSFAEDELDTMFSQIMMKGKDGAEEYGWDRATQPS